MRKETGIYSKHIGFHRNRVPGIGESLPVQRERAQLGIIYVGQFRWLRDRH